MIYCFDLYEARDFVGTRDINAASEKEAEELLELELVESGEGCLEYELLEVLEEAKA